MGDIPSNVQHDLDVEAYAAVVRSFYAGSLTYEHEKLLTSLKELFKFNDEMHLAIRKEQEVEIQAIRTGVRAGGNAGRVKSKMITGAAQAARFGKGLSLPPSLVKKKSTPIAKPKKKDNNNNNNNGSHQEEEGDSEYEEEPSAGGTAATGKGKKKGAPKAGATTTATTKKKKLPPPQQQYSAGRDRRPGGGGGGGKAFHRTGSAAAGGGRSGRAAYDDPYGYVGRRVWRLWPEENPPWVEGYVTAYDPTSDSHTILYDPNTGEQETSEAFSFTIANPAEYVLDEMVHLQTMVGSRRQREKPVPLEPVAPPPPGGFPVGGGGGGGGGYGGYGGVGYGGGGGLGGAPSLKRRKSVAAPVPPYAPFDATYLASRLEVAQEDELTQMLVILQRREEEVGNEIVQLEDAILHGADLEKRSELEKQFEELCKREMEVMAELKKLREEPES